MKARFIRMEWENDLRTIASFYFEPLGRYRYEAGQYAELSVPHEPFDNRGYSRTMTLSSSPHDPWLRFTMRLLPTGGSSFKQALQALAPGAVITIFDAMGDLVLPLSAEIPLVFIAGGVGVASFSGMTKFLAETDDARPVQLHYTVARPGDVVLQESFNKYRHLTNTLYTPSINSGHDYKGAVKQKRLEADDVLAMALPGSQFYISGTEKMVESLHHGLLDHGVDPMYIVFDFFDGYKDY
jgi:ferredoxin-NADP reductase